MSEKRGIYIHVPFCKGKCLYCDFYSVNSDQERMDAYTRVLCETIRRFPGNGEADTVYFGGGTPSLLGQRNLLTILETVGKKFGVSPNAEITAEVNPGDDLRDLLKDLYTGGFNRLSIGMQSVSDKELRLLGRRHTFRDTQKTVQAAVQAGFQRYSLDLMLAIPEQTQKSLASSIKACGDLGAAHVSAYLLKLEEGTPFWNQRNSLALPDEEAVCALYRQACMGLEALGLRQYEISNFAVPGQESRHNMKYWLDQEYIGFGPAAYSYYQGRRFHYKRALNAFLNGEPPIDDETGGDEEEYLMMRLRLCQGVSRAELDERFGEGRFDRLLHHAKPFAAADLMTISSDRAALTREGFLISNYIIARLLPD